MGGAQRTSLEADMMPPPEAEAASHRQASGDRDENMPAEIGGLIVERLMGRGSAGSVWACRDIALGRSVAVKLLHKSIVAGDVARARFDRECRALAQIKSPRVVQIYSTGMDVRGPYLVMELVDGESLAARIERVGALAWRDAVAVAVDVARALRDAASAGVVHRDVKPQNILLDDRGALLSDFGLARSMRGSAAITQQGMIVGTASYLAPELVRGEPPSFASDAYALGAVIYEMLAGEPPFFSERTCEVLFSQLNANVTPIISKKADLPPALARLVGRLLVKQPASRLADYDEIIRGLLDVERQVERGSLVNAPDEAAEPVERTVKIKRLDVRSTEALQDETSEQLMLPETAPVRAFRRARASFAELSRSHAGKFASSVALVVALAAAALAVFAVERDPLERIKRGDADAVRQEIEAIEVSARSPDDAVALGFALMALERPEDAFAAWADAAKRGKRHPEVRAAALARLAHPKAGAALDVLAAWSDDVVPEIVDHANASEWTARHNALLVLERRGDEALVDREALAIQDVDDADSCARRKASSELLRAHGKSESSLAALKRAKARADNACFSHDLRAVETAVRARIQHGR